MLLLYFGPELIMPVASAAAAALGALLMFGRRALAAARSILRRIGSFFRGPSGR